MIDPFEKLDQELNGTKEEIDRENLDMQKKFRKVFSDYDGKIVLNVLLNDLMLFQPCNSERETALRNYATYLIQERMGYKDTVSMTDALLNCKHE